MSLEVEIQKAVYATLAANAGVKALIGDPARVYDRVPDNFAFPYVTIGDDQIIDDSNSCADAFEVFCSVHVWSRAVGRIEAKTIGAAVREALDSQLSITGFTVAEWRAQPARYFVEPDGLTTHGVLVFRYLIDAA